MANRIMTKLRGTRNTWIDQYDLWEEISKESGMETDIKNANVVEDFKKSFFHCIKYRNVYFYHQKWQCFLIYFDKRNSNEDSYTEKEIFSEHIPLKKFTDPQPGGAEHYFALKTMLKALHFTDVEIIHGLVESKYFWWYEIDNNKNTLLHNILFLGQEQLWNTFLAQNETDLADISREIVMLKNKNSRTPLELSVGYTSEGTRMGLKAFMLGAFREMEDLQEKTIQLINWIRWILIFETLFFITVLYFV